MGYPNCLETLNLCNLHMLSASILERLSRSLYIHMMQPSIPDPNKPTRACIFCEATPTSAEHLFPAWIGRLFEERGVNSIHRSGTSDKGILREWKKARPLQYTVRVVCKNCNNGWMSDIESQVIAIISPMIMGKANPLNPMVLDEKSKRTVSIWLALRAIIYWQCQKELPKLPFSWLQEIKDEKRCPKGWSVWIGANNGAVTPYYLELTSELEIVDNGIPVVHQGLLMTGNLGNFVFKVSALRNSERIIGHTLPDYIIRTSPSNNTLSSWPPKVTMDKDSMANFFNHGSYHYE